MTTKTSTHKVIRKGFYQRFNGKLQALPVGTELSLNDKQGKLLTGRGIVKPIEPEKTVKEQVKPPKIDKKEDKSKKTAKE